MDKIKIIEASYLKSDIPHFSVGDFIKVLVRIPEGDKVRIHPFEGTVIRKRGQGIASSFTVRKITYGEGVERTFPSHSPTLERIEVLKKGKTRRSKLYYLRSRVGKATKIKKQKE